VFGREVLNQGIKEVFFGEGIERADAGAISAVTFRTTSAITAADKAGASIVWESGKGTGSATPSTFAWKTPTSLGSGTTQQTVTTRLEILADGTVSAPGSATWSEQFGAGASATGLGSLAVGTGAVTNNGVAVGSFATGAGVVIGAFANSTGGVSIGASSDATGFNGSVAVGGVAQAVGDRSTAIGNNTTASQTGSTALGDFATCTGPDGLALGRNASVGWSRSIALGKGANTSTHINSIAIGTDSTADASNQIAFGSGGGINFYTAMRLGCGASSQFPQSVFSLGPTKGITGANVVGTGLVVHSGEGTGSGGPSTISLQTPNALGSGTTTQSLVTRVTLSESTITIGSASDEAINLGEDGAITIGTAGATLNFFAAGAVSQQADTIAITDNSGGVANSTIAAITDAANTGSADVGPVADAIADLAAKYNALRTLLRNYGLMA